MYRSGFTRCCTGCCCSGSSSSGCRASNDQKLNFAESHQKNGLDSLDVSLLFVLQQQLAVIVREGIFRLSRHFHLNISRDSLRLHNEFSYSQWKLEALKRSVFSQRSPDETYPIGRNADAAATEENEHDEWSDARPLVLTI